MPLPTDRQALIEAIDAGLRPRFLLFWGHRPPRSGRIGPSCLSQWWAQPFSVDGTTYRTAEHWMMAEKARLFGDAAAEAGVLASATPKEAKAWGRQVQGFDTDTWDAHKFDIVRTGSTHKFSQPDLRAYLLSTDDAVLVEASPSDAVWGIAMGAKNKRCHDPRQWQGENLLGFALMAARDVLAELPA